MRQAGTSSSTKNPTRGGIWFVIGQGAIECAAAQRKARSRAHSHSGVCQDQQWLAVDCSAAISAGPLVAACAVPTAARAVGPRFNAEIRYATIDLFVCHDARRNA